MRNLTYPYWSAVLFLSIVATAAPTSVQASPKKDKTEKEERRRQKAIQKEMESPYKKWLEEEVPYIITPQERAAFKKLATDEERENFIESFWERRNPNPGSPENEFKEEYYRRIAYANEHYASGVPGWKTDRGRIYIMWGPPDEIDSHPSGGNYTPSPNELPYTGPGVQNEMTTYPFETWRYRYLEGIGTNVELEFVDPTMTGEYHLTMNPCEKDAMAQVPNDSTGCAGPAAIGPVWNPASVIAPGGGNASSGSGMVTSNMAMGEQMNEFTRLDLYAKIFKAPDVKFKDLKAVVTSKLSAQLLPFDVREDFVRLTEESVLTPITVQLNKSDLQFQNKGGVMHGVMDVFGQLSTLGGRIVQTFQESAALDVPEHDFPNYVKTKAVYQKVLPLRPGRYKLSVVVKDDVNGHMGSMELGIQVPHFDDEKLSNSSLILADQIQQLPTRQVGSGPFVIGGTRVRPRVDDTFTREQNLGIYMQVYNLGLDSKTHKPSADIVYDISRDGKTVLNRTEEAGKMPNAGAQVTIEKTMPLRTLPPGRYTVAIQVKDKVKNQTITPSVAFEVR